MVTPPQSALRRELRNLLADSALPRPPALRRSRRPDFLFASDLPSFAPPEALASFRQKAEAAGWEAWSSGGWLELRKPLSGPPEGFRPFPPGEESACCESLLCRHPGGAESREASILLIKAAEEGPAAFEAACRTLHRDFARRLRLGLPLPALSPDFFR